jgi:hypothetical protein
MDDPLENDVKRGPEEEVGDSEPGEPLQERERERRQKPGCCEQNVVQEYGISSATIWRFTRLFKAASPSRKTALTECIPTSSCHKEKSH